MNRTIKFRGFNLKNKQWICGYYLVNRGKHYIVMDEVVSPFVEESDFEVDPESVGQLVGFRKGLEIFDGDIIRYELKFVDDVLPHTEYKSIEGIVVWQNREQKYVLRLDNGIDCPVTGDYSMFKVDVKDYKVIGNEYEKKLSNPGGRM